ncbi:MAG: hypothetical protein PCFJNLEI_00965 [Verrucomicrobiae bacterium]|nr:hypothetical protein [Verrucomicrobiae bacterium]
MAFTVTALFERMTVLLPPPAWLPAELPTASAPVAMNNPPLVTITLLPLAPGATAALPPPTRIPTTLLMTPPPVTNSWLLIDPAAPPTTNAPELLTMAPLRVSILPSAAPEPIVIPAAATKFQEESRKMVTALLDEPTPIYEL